MKIKFLGSGSAFTLAEENYQSNILITKEDKHLLYDCGTTIPEALNEAGLKPQDLDSIYVSHLHADHAGGIEYIGFKTYFEVFNFGKTEFGTMKPKLYGHKSILYNGWDGTWKGGLQSIQGMTNSLESYFDTTYMESNDEFGFYGIKIQPIQGLHSISDSKIEKAYGIMIQNKDGEELGQKVYISGDNNPFQ